MLYRIAKILNHNSFIGIQDENNQECLVMGKGVAFGKKVGQTVPISEKVEIYSLEEMTERGDAKDIIKSVSPLCLELANEVLGRAEEEFGKVDRLILFTMADHLDFAIRRIQNGEQISNPLTEDIRIMFYKEYKVAACIRELLKEKLGIEIDDHEIGYIALHVHAAIVDENVSQAMEIARTVRECISIVEKETGKSIDEANLMSIGYFLEHSHVEILCQDFEKTCESAQAGDFVYFDSPYIPVSETANFTDYTKDGFTYEDHVRLAELYKRLAAKGVKVMLSNHDVPLVYELYEGFKIENVDVRRSINSDAKKRVGKEVIITNYEV